MLADPRYDRATRVARYGADLGPTEIACYLSHITLFERCLREGVDRAVIVEDDVHPAAHFADALDALSAAPEAFEFVRLIGTRPRPSEPVASLTEDVRLVWPTHGLCGAQGYYLTRAAMQKLVSKGLPITLPFDMMLDRYWRTGITIFALDPYVVHDPLLGDSDIGKRPDAWDERPRPWLRARLKLGKLWERGERTIANADRRARLPEWRRQAQAAFCA
jgi:glycosyl transferase family 25